MYLIFPLIPHHTHSSFNTPFSYSHFTGSSWDIHLSVLITCILSTHHVHMSTIHAFCHDTNTCILSHSWSHVNNTCILSHDTNTSRTHVTNMIICNIMITCQHITITCHKHEHMSHHHDHMSQHDYMQHHDHMSQHDYMQYHDHMSQHHDHMSTIHALCHIMITCQQYMQHHEHTSFLLIIRYYCYLLLILTLFFLFTLSICSYEALHLQTRKFTITTLL